jgi:hypothetical protein
VPRARLTSARPAQFGLAAGLLAAAPLAALSETAPKPPLWASLAECSAVFAAVSLSDERYAGGDPATPAMAAQAAVAFLDRAVATARASCQADPVGDVAWIMTCLLPRWDNRIGKSFSVPSNLRWIDYCGRIGRQEGLLPLVEWA